MTRRTYNIAMVSDFFFPQPGGVESHIYQVASKLIDRGHKVVIITHEYGDRKGVRYLTNGIKVYHVPFLVIYRSTTFPTVFSFFPLFRNIVIREQIDIVHGHASLSSLCHEAILHARTMGLRTVYTDHSLFGFADATSILANKLLKFGLSDVDHVICVSHTCKENTVLRASLDPLLVSVIPNAVVAENFKPLSTEEQQHLQSQYQDRHHRRHTSQDSQASQGNKATASETQQSGPSSSLTSNASGSGPLSSQHPTLHRPSSSSSTQNGTSPPKPSFVSQAASPPTPAHLLSPHDPITIVVISRLFYNKGTDLLVAAIPRILENHPNTRFIIAGSGPKAIDLKQMIEQNVLQDRVEMLGPVRHEDVRDVMVRGHIYLHPSLTEAFGTVIVEAASCGLYVVCTQVGGIPEVLPSHMTVFARPEEDDLVAATGRAIGALRANKVRTERFHEQVKAMYSWTNVAARTERVYNGITGAISEAEFYGYDMATNSGNGGGGTAGGWSATRGRSGVQSFALIDRLKRYYGCGIWAGKLFCLCVVIDYLLYLFCEFWWPRDRIDICPDWPRKTLQPQQEKEHIR
ncbi:phosphatidylinositol N-acetylglucosaminyltransferase GPI3 subunit [Sporothrix brasiliensis 5110]|uniref:Phosphatidylinositol N-acetylglucosaminyltransferase GPI3 subunit n=1 Tax=Sporothrix brasiliensis 5110 TaxID=1398154 RepID=A0A0C2ILX7_9PEZI|nr:phosphatidylinositol N-acetylglucosaminyltransferase GPI3 subunit [Sporothrix brasiliensis 5110]KIH90081.1 phosphatidylinositol N-acetylglucosaminyltransferase GPI3 subunit [Sporothrix brasiliensis 5110]